MFSESAHFRPFGSNPFLKPVQTSTIGRGALKFATQFHLYIMNLSNYLFDLFVYFSHLLVMRISPLHAKRQEMTKTDELEFKVYVESIAYIQIQTLGDS